MSRHLYCLNKNTARSTGLTLASGRCFRSYYTQEEKDKLTKLGYTGYYRIQPGTVEEIERDYLEIKAIGVL